MGAAYLLPGPPPVPVIFVVVEYTQGNSCIVRRLLPPCHTPHETSGMAVLAMQSGHSKQFVLDLFGGGGLIALTGGVVGWWVKS
jgi:hypothetical protein